MTHPWHEQNRLSWNEATRRHNAHKGDQAAFFREGGDTLFPEDDLLLGDIRGLEVVHLQCNSGQDTLSLAHRGARAHGVDISDEAVAFAARLSAEAGIPATFERADLFDWFEATDRRFDVAYASYGALGWLSDLGVWARGIRRVLRPGGRLVVVEFHSVAFLFDAEMRLHEPYSTAGREPLHTPKGVGDYVGDSGESLGGGKAIVEAGWTNPHPTVEFAWGIADVVQPLLDAGLVLERLVEWPYSNGCRIWPSARPLPDRRWTTPEGVPELPLMFGLVARAP